MFSNGQSPDQKLTQNCHFYTPAASPQKDFYDLVRAAVDAWLNASRPARPRWPSGSLNMCGRFWRTQLPFAKQRLFITFHENIAPYPPTAFSFVAEHRIDSLLDRSIHSVHLAQIIPGQQM